MYYRAERTQTNRVCVGYITIKINDKLSQRKVKTLDCGQEVYLPAALIQINQTWKSFQVSIGIKTKRDNFAGGYLGVKLAYLPYSNTSVIQS